MQKYFTCIRLQCSVQLVISHVLPRKIFKKIWTLSKNIFRHYVRANKLNNKACKEKIQMAVTVDKESDVTRDFECILHKVFFFSFFLFSSKEKYGIIHRSLTDN